MLRGPYFALLEEVRCAAQATQFSRPQFCGARRAAGSGRRPATACCGRRARSGGGARRAYTRAAGPLTHGKMRAAARRRRRPSAGACASVSTSSFVPTMAALRAAASSRIAYIDRPAPPRHRRLRLVSEESTTAVPACADVSVRADHEWATDGGVITRNTAAGMDGGTREAVFFSHACNADNTGFLYRGETVPLSAPSSSR